MKTYKVLIQPTAKNDILEIGDYISNVLCAPAAAATFTQKFIDSVKKLADFPNVGKRVEANVMLKYEYRRLVIENYIAFYIVDEESSTVKIMRVLYGQSDYIKNL
ncbi:MAG: type II toxin-antitoxin system RelE/ParE family toxin [Clostridia bacterium]|nr:type II toxin-antitoxin system RelE/ParE family toxin [Clostridia bacterium]